MSIKATRKTLLKLTPGHIFTKLFDLSPIAIVVEVRSLIWRSAELFTKDRRILDVLGDSSFYELDPL